MEEIIFPPHSEPTPGSSCLGQRDRRHGRSEQGAAADLGARTHFLQKPFGVVELTQKIRTLVDGAAAAHR